VKNVLLVRHVNFTEPVFVELFLNLVDLAAVVVLELERSEDGVRCGPETLSEYSCALLGITVDQISHTLVVVLLTFETLHVGCNGAGGSIAWVFGVNMVIQ